MEWAKRAHSGPTPSLEHARLEIFLQKASQRPVSYLILVKGIRFSNRSINPEKTADLSCRGWLLLIEKSPLTEKHLKQQILTPNQILADSVRDVEIAKFAIPTFGITSANP
jgi:hypothetical protein